jgi:hypothetical protein
LRQSESEEKAERENVRIERKERAAMAAALLPLQQM